MLTQTPSKQPSTTRSCPVTNSESPHARNSTASATCFGVKKTILDLDFSAYDRLLAVNARGTAACVKHAARSMVERRVRGSIVCTASVSASHGGLRRTDYVMSKHAVKGLMRAASAQLGAHGVRVNCVSPSGLTTPLTRAAHAAMETRKLRVAHNT